MPQRLRQGDDREPGVVRSGMSMGLKSPLPPAVILLSGGLDSATVLAMAQRAGFACHCISFDYGQRHRWELPASREVARQLNAASHRTVTLDLRAIGGSALTADIDVPKDRSEGVMAAEIPVTYVPARNLVFLSLAAGLAEVIGAWDIFIGVNAVDYSGYPDCRPEFLESFQRTVNLATKAGVTSGVGDRATPEGGAFAAHKGLQIHAPIVRMTKAKIIRTGTALGVDYSMTHSCYDPGAAALGSGVGSGSGELLACGRCDSCQIRRQGFLEAGVADPTRYR